MGTTNEEFFHAYQNYYYGRSRMNRMGGSNIELEPRFMAGYKMIAREEMIITMPGQERMFNLLYNVDANRLTPTQQQQYLGAVESFRQMWVKENLRDHTNNLYDDPRTADGPEAAFDIINKVRHAPKK